MLRIKRASAGSGKTYELAKTFIKFLITTKKPGYRRQMMKDGSFREALSGIMAVTFTVKATAEMKQRIVEKLAALAMADIATPEQLKKTDYLEEFVSDLHTDRYEIAELARKALETLLLHYSDFKVQTIDSFFQSILHTFTYEASLDDNFNTEINTDMVTAAGFDAALEALTSGEVTDHDTLFWLRKMMGNVMDRNKWNVFTRDTSEKSLYSELIKEAGNLQKEEYQELREELMTYFESLDRPFKEIMEEVDEANSREWVAFHETRKRAAKVFMDELLHAGLDASSVSNSNGAQLKASLEEFDPSSFTPPAKLIGGRKAVTAFSLSGPGEKLLKAAVAARPDLNSTTVYDIDSAFTEWMNASNAYMEAFGKKKEALATWRRYREMIPRLMMVLEIARRKDAYLKATNTLQLSDTAHILSRIIGKDDTPFVYERMGSRLRHFLIDEFQDTSGLQWKNLKPLVDESEATDNDNLIIGDAKQSIYRFRNADYTLITGLERQFPNYVYYTREEEPSELATRNTNYRSLTRIVEFNNFIFSRLPYIEVTVDKQRQPLFTDTVRDIYRDCEQAVPEKRREGAGPQGYVELTLYTKKAENKNGNSKEDLVSQPGFSTLPERIMELRGRGYSFRDIGILVKKHEQGAAVVEVISEYNELHKNNPIPIISEENLLVSSSLSVKIIISALEMAAGRPVPGTKENEVLHDPVDRQELYSLLRSLNTLALPSIVEAIIGRFVPEARRNSETPYIAAFQDAVIDYAISRPGDIGSFLKWWEQKSKSLSITSPEGSDGVVLQTVHKAKGLEYKCVIIPSANYSFTPGNFKEWKWVRTTKEIEKADLLPPRLPVFTEKGLAETVHKDVWERYCEEFALDELNKMYVAFTRAADELYIFAPMSMKPDETKAGGALSLLFSSDGPASEGCGLPADLLNIEEDEEAGTKTVRFGTPSTPGQIKAEKEKEARGEQGAAREVVTIDSYVTVDDIPSGKGEENRATTLFNNDRPLKTIVHPDGREEEIDPRAEGTLKHRILQMVEKPSDLDKALLRMKVEGIVSARQAEQWGEELRKAIEGPDVAHWFSPTARVVNERPLIVKGAAGNRRPDRIVVTPDNDAVIIDYKFGEEGSYRRQLREYADLLRMSGSYRSVSAYIWYVSSGKIERVAP